ncbi:MAG: transcription-repair coupling factor [Prevotellaceae bacterium]|jgi:transcription-repair coupling factor (superfamily II helicase)|nr:transcription-repair coupling factor [Prevotellaceae bacterium]
MAEKLINNFVNQDGYKILLSEIKSDRRSSIVLKGLAGSAKSVLAACFFQTNANINIFVLSEKETAAYFYTDLYNLAQNENILFFPSSLKRNVQDETVETANIVQRTKCLNLLNEGKRKNICLVTYPEGLTEKVVAPDVLNKNTLTVRKNDKPGLDFVVEMLVSYGFERTDFVFEPGQYSVRGSILDVFSYSTNKPYRIDFFGDEIESIRIFDLDTQLSIENINETEIISNLEQNRKDYSIFDFIENSACIWFDDYDFCSGKADEINKIKNQSFISENVFSEQTEKFRILSFSPVKILNNTVKIEFKTSPQPNFNKNFDMLSKNIRENSENGYDTVILFDNTVQNGRLRQIFESGDKHENLSFDSINISIHEGFIDHVSKISYYTDHQIFQRYHRFKIHGMLDRGEILNIQELNKLQVGDYIVHIDHGVGIFGGLVKQEVNGKIQEAVKLVYRDSDVLFVNIHGLHRISKFKGKDSEPPKIYKLGNGDWQRLKQNTKKKIKDMAHELILLYAERKAAKGFAFSADSYMQHELEASFVYEDTPDQMKASGAVKEDMELSSPMDRLICGDVGFGKTEIAVRAAFKAAVDGKQTAILVPTTILALQHHKTFSERLQNFPVKIDFLNRLKTAKQQTETLKNIENGNTDIIIGTHKLLGKNVKFKDLGLLIVDEEQKFGVSAKEKLRQIKMNVDTLTMTATPIPRTLQFSLMGARDLSIINTPPPNRHPIVTEVHTFNSETIKDAINYELERSGQVFFVHNRIDDINRIAEMIVKLCPNAKIATGHGRLESKKLEEIMLGFIDGKYDVLLTTTIIESGLDIPNANTIIIDHAQNFGLSDLHQLRGRVGRSNKKAFCYLLTPPPASLTTEARRRLKAIEEFSDLGSGFNISMQDLDIRGAGNLLGGEQSGFISDIGFETYQRILNEALAELKSDTEFEKTNLQKQPVSADISFISDCYIDTDIDANLPDEYVSNSSEKIKLYRDLNSIDDENDLIEFRKKMIDRFGEIPLPSENLFNIVRLRRIAIKLGFERIILRNQMMIAYFISNQMSAYYKTQRFIDIIQYIQSNPEKFKMKEHNKKLSLTVQNVKTMEDCLSLFMKIL